MRKLRETPFEAEIFFPAHFDATDVILWMFDRGYSAEAVKGYNLDIMENEGGFYVVWRKIRNS